MNSAQIIKSYKIDLEGPTELELYGGSPLFASISGDEPILSIHVIHPMETPTYPDKGAKILNEFIVVRENQPRNYLVYYNYLNSVIHNDSWYHIFYREKKQPPKY